MLPTESLNLILSSGKVESLTKEKIASQYSKSLGFLNILVSGSLKINRENSFIYEPELVAKPGHPFGNMVHVLGFGRLEMSFRTTDQRLLQNEKETGGVP